VKRGEYIHPMPAGPKRMKLETWIKARTFEMGKCLGDQFRVIGCYGHRLLLNGFPIHPAILIDLVD
jgi:hypothetical protein